MNRVIKVSVPITGEEEAEAVREVILSGNFVSGKRVARFEEEFATYIGSASGCALNSCTAALHVALAVLDIGPGDEVVVPPMTFMSTITAVMHQGAVPIFADVDPETFCMDPAELDRVAGPRTKAVIPVHLYGNACDMDAIMEIAGRRGLTVIEDCAQAHGTEYKGRRVGSIGHMGAFSFYATKHMTTGEGGLLTSDNAEWMSQAKKIRSHGLINRDDHELLGYNYRMTEMAAAIGLVQLAKLDDFNERRIENCEQLLRRLSEYPDRWFKLPRIPDHVRHTYFWCPLIVDRSKGYSTADVVKRLRDRGIEVRQRYQEPLNRQRVLQRVAEDPRNTAPDYRNLELPVSESLAGNIIGLPNHPRLSQDDLDVIVEAVVTLYDS